MSPCDVLEYRRIPIILSFLVMQRTSTRKETHKFPFSMSHENCKSLSRYDLPFPTSMCIHDETRDLTRIHKKDRLYNPPWTSEGTIGGRANWVHSEPKRFASRIPFVVQRFAMHLYYYLGEDGKRVYTLKVCVLRRFCDSCREKALLESPRFLLIPVHLGCGFHSPSSLLSWW